MPRDDSLLGTDVPGPLDVLASWAREGPLVHEPTGLEALDAATGGGPVYGSRWYVQGAPDAGKTALLVHIAHRYAERGIAVGLLAVDEEPADIVTRLAQRIGFTRTDCERRDPATLARMRDALEALPIRFFSAEATIEAAAAAIATFAAERGARAMLAIDSVQTVRCEAELVAEREPSMPQAIEARVRAIRAAATEHRLIAIATSEMARAAYRNRAARDATDAMATAKWSGAVEYSARVLLALRNVPGSPDVIEVEVPKNKHGRACRADDGGAMYLAIDRSRQTLEATEAPAREERSDEERSAAQDAKIAQMAEKILGALVRANAKGRRITSRDDLRGLVPGANDVKTKAVSRLIASGRIEGGRGRPFAPRHEDEGESDATGPIGPDRSERTDAPHQADRSAAPSEGAEDGPVGRGASDAAAGPGARTDPLDGRLRG